MKLRLLAIVSFIAVFSSCQQATWTELKPGDGAIVVSMPGDPKAQVQRVATQAGDIEVHSFVLEKKDIAYSVTYNDFPAALLSDGNSDRMLNGARDGAVSSVKGKLLTDTGIALQEFPGREINIEAPDGKHTVVSRIYLVKSRLYQISVAVPNEDLQREDVAKFLDSFKLLRH
jgi:hypothetical protein